MEGTNLINLAVTAASPELCFKLMQSILKNYSLVSDYMTGNAILEILKAPKVPLTPDQPFERRNIMIKAFLAAAACWSTDLRRAVLAEGYDPHGGRH